jgi:hypothetical protein
VTEATDLERVLRGGGHGVGHTVRWPPMLLVSFSLVQRDLVDGGSTSRRLPDSGLLGPWGVAFHGEEEMEVHLVKWVRMPP